MRRLAFLSTKPKEVIDITDEIQRYADEQSVDDGVILLFLTHTSAALTTADLDPGGTDQDYLDAFEKIVPKLQFRHPHNPEHMPDHILSSAIGTSLTVPVENERLVLGQWQRIVLIEFDGPRERSVIASHIREQK